MQICLEINLNSYLRMITTWEAAEAPAAAPNRHHDAASMGNEGYFRIGMPMPAQASFISDEVTAAHDD